MTGTLLTDKQYTIEKFEGKGGWTYVRLPEIAPSKNAPFGWVRVSGSVDHYPIKAYNLQSMGQGIFFLPLKAELRKHIKKQAGDLVHVLLFEDNTPTEIPEELILCLSEENQVYETFCSYSDGEKKNIVDWIYAAKTDRVKVERIVKTLEHISAKII
ncbi:YdeI/OmpD-associated family protein [Sphingobacterium tabacisoli]|uniref:YdeI/OmpD-associated family protein n=1 Tax=Sphingobacterium tabacisoli TaxID=2044855 RepID=A0ABW5L0V3_9SPHI|nr:YdeI/OmpD-associated family protein [Sphingobacterium tabacisoli]